MAEKKEKADQAEKEPKAGGTDLQTVEKNTGTDVVAGNSQDDDFFAGAGEGLGDFSQSDFLIPYVRIIQALSKELQKGHAKFREGAAQGMFINSATRQLWPDTGFLVIPVAFGHRYMAWRPNNAGPAYDMGEDPTKFNSVTPEPEDSKNAGKRFDESGNELTDSLQYFTILVDPESGEWQAAVLNFGGSQARKGRGWATTINNRMERYPAGHAKAGQPFRPAIYFYSYKVTTVPESNDKGSWYGFSIQEGPKVMDLPNGREIFRAASELRKRIAAGEVKAAVEEPHEEEGSGDGAF